MIQSTTQLLRSCMVHLSENIHTHFVTSGHFLLTNLLLDKLKQSAPSRIVIVSSKLHEDNQFDFDDVNCEVNYNSTVAYGRSKTANILFATKLVEMLEGMTLYLISSQNSLPTTQMQITMY